VVLRWQTVALFLVLIGTALVALLYHHPSPTAESSGEESAYYEPTPTQAAQAYATLTTPKGFTRTTSGCSGGICFDRLPSLVPSIPNLSHWLSEAGLTLDREWWPTPECRQGRLGHSAFFEINCAAPATRGKLVFLAQLGSLVFKRDGRFYGTRRLLGHGIPKLGGLHIALSDFGVPLPSTIKEIKETLRHNHGHLQNIPLPGEPLSASQ
jgi:hypothetical protein